MSVRAWAKAWVKSWDPIEIGYLAMHIERTVEQ